MECQPRFADSPLFPPVPAFFCQPCGRDTDGRFRVFPPVHAESWPRSDNQAHTQRKTLCGQFFQSLCRPNKSPPRKSGREKRGANFAVRHRSLFRRARLCVLLVFLGITHEFINFGACSLYGFAISLVHHLLDKLPWPHFHFYG